MLNMTLSISLSIKSSENYQISDNLIIRILVFLRKYFPTLVLYFKEIYVRYIWFLFRLLELLLCIRLNRYLAKILCQNHQIQLYSLPNFSWNFLWAQRHLWPGTPSILHLLSADHSKLSMGLERDLGDVSNIFHSS